MELPIPWPALNPPICATLAELDSSHMVSQLSLGTCWDSTTRGCTSRAWMKCCRSIVTSSACKPQFELSRPRLRVVMLTADAGRLELLEMTPTSEEERRAPGLRHVAFEVADVAACADLSHEGYSFLEPPIGGAAGWPRACFFRAPHGTYIELIQPLATRA